MESALTTREHAATDENELRHRSFQIRVASGPDEGAVANAVGREISVGTAAGNHLVLTDPEVARYHLVIRWSPRGYWARDLGSTSGMTLGGHLVQAAALRDGSTLAIGRTVLVFELREEEISEPLAKTTRWGSLIGESSAMRRLFALLPRIAQSPSTVLIEGEAGTGKRTLARAIHDASPRAIQPFVALDCSAIAPALMESALFGHERGAYPGAHASRAGAFETAAGGALFLNEIGELPLELQPKLLRVLESRHVQRLGRNDGIALDVRVIAATSRDLREMVNRGLFRADLYYRLKGATIELPPLRDRRADVPALIAHFWAQLTGGKAPPDGVLAAFTRLDWLGNVRELEVAVEREVVTGVADAARDLGGHGWPHARAATDPPEPHVDVVRFDPEVPFRDAKNQAIERWERWYIRELLAYTGGNLSQAARVAQSDRSYLRKLVRRYASATGAGAGPGPGPGPGDVRGGGGGGTGSGGAPAGTGSPGPGPVGVLGLGPPTRNLATGTRPITGTRSPIGARGLPGIAPGLGEPMSIVEAPYLENPIEPELGALAADEVDLDEPDVDELDLGDPDLREPDLGSLELSVPAVPAVPALAAPPLTPECPE